MIERLLRRDEAGMSALLLHYGSLMRYMIAPILQDPQDREDCLSEAAMRVWEKAGQFDRARGSWTAWLTALTRNVALNYTREARRRSSVEELPDDTPSPDPSPEELLLQKERQAAVRHQPPVFQLAELFCLPGHPLPHSLYRKLFIKKPPPRSARRGWFLIVGQSTTTM